MLIKITVKPNTREEKIQKIGEDEYLVMLKESPKHGRPKARLLNLLTHFFKETFVIDLG